VQPDDVGAKQQRVTAWLQQRDDQAEKHDSRASEHLLFCLINAA
jgi:hypothetical protein